MYECHFFVSDLLWIVVSVEVAVCSLFSHYLLFTSCCTSLTTSLSVFLGDSHRSFTSMCITSSLQSTFSFISWPHLDHIFDSSLFAQFSSSLFSLSVTSSLINHLFLSLTLLSLMPGLHCTHSTSHSRHRLMDSLAQFWFFSQIGFHSCCCFIIWFILADCQLFTHYVHVNTTWDENRIIQCKCILQSAEEET